MRTSNFYLFPLKETPNDAFLISHKLMLRSNMVRQSATGIYTWLPFGLIVLKNIEKIIRELHHECSVHELLMPTIQSADLWKKSERYSDYGKEMLRILDRNKSELLYGPTNEELITNIVSKDIKSYKDFPKILYHIQWKFRDEVRPRFGVMRCREFLMKDAYSFDVDYESAYFSYCKMFLLYLKIFKKMGIKALPFEAETGPIGGSLSHEFILETNNGESEIFYDKTISNINFDNIDFHDSEQIKKLVSEYSKYYSRTSEKHDNKAYEKNVALNNRKNSKGIEIGHIFYFGTKYSEKLNAFVQDKNGKRVPVHMGSYGIGVSRLVGALIEANHDEKGIKWPKSVAPFKLSVVNLMPDDQNCTTIAEDYYSNFMSQNIDTLFDDRDCSIGKKLSDNDLIGTPFQIVIGKRDISQGLVEVKDRLLDTSEKIKIEDVKRVVLQKLNS